MVSSLGMQAQMARDSLMMAGPFFLLCIFVHKSSCQGEKQKDEGRAEERCRLLPSFGTLLNLLCEKDGRPR